MTDLPADVEAINASIRYVLYAVFATDAPLPLDHDERRALVEDSLTWVEGSGVVIRGFYDLAGMRADADLLVWLHGEGVEQVQDAYHRLVGSPLGQYLRCTWSAVGLHRPAEFNRSHVPAFLAGEEPGRYLCVYPFVRSYERVHAQVPPGLLPRKEGRNVRPVELGRPVQPHRGPGAAQVLPERGSHQSVVGVLH